MDAKYAGLEHYMYPSLLDKAKARCDGCPQQTVHYKKRWCSLQNKDISAVASCDKGRIE